MKAVVFTGHPSWKNGLNEQTRALWCSYLDRIPRIDEYELHDVYGLTPPMMEQFIGDADILVGWFIGPNLDEAFFRRHPNLRYVSTLSMGYGSFDRELMKKQGVTLACTPYGANTIAEFTMAMLLEICHSVGANAAYIRNTQWTPELFEDIEENSTRQIELYDKTMGIIGLGKVGAWVGRMARSFGMKVIGCARTPKTGPDYEGIEQVSQDELFARADVISLNCSANPSTEGIINKENIRKMKDGVILINTARGELVIEDDLIEALNSRKIYMAGLDATMFDYKRVRTPLMDNPYAVITGHIAWQPMDARLRDIRIAAEHLEAWANGTFEGSGFIFR